ncbi:cysteinyl-tRNA synthetase [Ascosphaera aggregata]|nr:cysteinyl-tRNA synthetase [Ascosphaera aggregata]
MAPRLTFLDISNNRVCDLQHANLNELHTLVSLKMANNKLATLPNYFAEFPSLRSLNISSNSFTEFPWILSQVSSLVELDISFNKVTRFPSVGNLTALERLWITNNQLRGKLPQEFKNLTSLKEIDARFNKISSIDNLSTLPRLEQLFVGHNAISQFVGSFPKLQLLYLDHCPVTIFDINEPMPTLHTLNLASAKLAQLKEDIFARVPNLTKLMLNKNRLSSLSPQIGLLQKLEYLSMVENRVTELPSTIGCLTSLKYLNLRECNLQNLPAEIWYCCSLETLNLSTNVLVSFPKLSGNGPPLPPVSDITHSPALSFEELGKLEDFENRRPSQTSGGTYPLGPPTPSNHRTGSITSMPPPTRKPSASSRAATDPMSSSRKDSIFSQRLMMTFAGSLRYLSLADNRLDDDIFQHLALLQELRVLNLSYNELTELPQGLIRRWRSLYELYLSGNEFSALPSDDFEESSQLAVLHINANKFQSLPAELSRAEALSVLDVGSNALKYNVSNWRYEWNWNWNNNLKYLNFSGNKRFEIKPHTAYATSVGTVDGTDLTNFSSLNDLRILGLIDVTLTTNTIPDETEDRRVRTSASLSEAITYGMADTLGRNDHLSMIDMVVPRFRGNEMETVLALFDGRALPNRGSKISKYLHEHFSTSFISELKKLREHEDAQDALRRSFLGLNKEMAVMAFKSVHDHDSGTLIRKDDHGYINQDDINAGAVATVLYLKGMDLYSANVGNTEAIVVSSNGSFRHLTQKHDPAEPSERERIREAGGYVSRNGRLNDQLNVSRAFGFFHLLPSIIAAPSTTKVTLTEQDEMVIMATSELWDYVSPEVVADIARAERSDLMLASQKLRDLAMAYGSTNKLMVMIAGVSDLRHRERNKFKGSNLTLGPSPISTEHIFPTAKRQKRGRDAPTDSRLARYDRVEAPTGELAIIFTDIKGSTSLWETNSPAMETAIQIHNELFRRQLGIIGGYEAKTEGDAFMVSFSTATAALLWTFSCQLALLHQPWPTEILESQPGEEEYDSDHNLIYRGLSVRMGIHWGRPVCARDPVTSRMDYFGPMVNRAARICNAADGGQILVSADFISEIHHDLDMFAGQERSNSTGSDDANSDDPFKSNIYRELTELSSKGFGVQTWGETKLKGLENPEMLYSVYPYSLSGRLEQQQSANNAPAPKDKEVHFDESVMWSLWQVVLRVERICSALETSSDSITPTDGFLIDLVKEEIGNYTFNRILLLLDHLITRLEGAVNTLCLRNMICPFRKGTELQKYGVPMADVLKQLSKEIKECRQLKSQMKTANPARRSSHRPSLPSVPASNNGDLNLHSSLDPVQIAADAAAEDEDEE